MREASGEALAAPDARSPATIHDPSATRKSFLIVGVLVVIGALLRLWHFLGNRSFWLDELFLALDIREQTFSGLVGELGRGQLAPTGFLLIEKAVTGAWGETTEHALRLLPFIASLLTLLLTYPVARLVTDRAGALFTLALCAVSPQAIYFAAEAKQYSLDALAGLVLTGLAVQYAIQPIGRRLLALAVAGIAAPWLSFPAAFVLAGIGFGLGLKFAIDGAHRKIAVIGAISVAWMASFFAQLGAANLWHGSTLPGMQTFWEPLFMPSPAALMDWLKWLGQHGSGFLDWPLGLTDWTLVALLALFGAVFVAGRDRWILVVLLFPVFAALVSSGIHLYPFGERFLFFSAPSVGMIAAIGMSALARQTPHGSIVAGLSAALILAPPLARSAVQVNKDPPFAREETRGLWEHVQATRLPSDPIYVSHGAIPSFEFYAKHTLSDAPIILGTRNTTDWAAYSSNVKQALNYPRIWLVFSHVRTERSGTREDLLALQALNGRQVEAKNAPGAVLYLLDLTRSPHPPSP